MSGGIAYLYSLDGTFDERNFNMEMIGVEDPSTDDLAQLEELINKHVKYTASNKATTILSNWKAEKKNFIKVMPTDYKKALARLAEEAKQEVN
jgi:glutamate synthase (ferredoxin)